MKRYAVLGSAVLIAAYLLVFYEAGQPIIAARFMWVLGRFDARVCAIVAPMALGAVMTTLGVLMGVMSFRNGSRRATFCWFFIADVFGPAVAIGGHAVAVALVGVPAV